MVTIEEHEKLVRDYTKAFIQLQVFKDKYTTRFDDPNRIQEFTYPTDVDELKEFIRLSDDLAKKSKLLNDSKAQ